MENTEPKRFNQGSPEVLERQRIEAIKKLSYQERLERLFVLIQLSNDMRTAHQKMKNESGNTQSM